MVKTFSLKSPRSKPTLIKCNQSKKETSHQATNSTIHKNLPLHHQWQAYPHGSHPQNLSNHKKCKSNNKYHTIVKESSRDHHTILTTQSPMMKMKKTAARRLRKRLMIKWRLIEISKGQIRWLRKMLLELGRNKPKDKSRKKNPTSLIRRRKMSDGVIRMGIGEMIQKLISKSK